MIYVHDNWGWGTLADQVAAFLSNYISDMIYDSSTKIMTFFDDKFSFQIADSNWPTLSLAYGSSRIQWDAEAMFREKEVYFVYSENFMQLKIYFPNSGQRWMIISYIKSSDGKYYAGGSVNSQTEYTLYNTPYYDVQNDTQLIYNFPKIINFAANPGKIVYAEQTPLVHSDSNICFFNDIFSCSTVPLRSTVTINGDNYLALDTNNLVLLDE